MGQLLLFESAPAVLVDETWGRVDYTPSFVAPELARRWFEELRDTVAWKAERRRMYDREVDVPRLTAHFHLADHPPAAVAEAADLGRAWTGVPFNSAGLNFYRDGRDSVAPHNDHLDELVAGHPIALVSLGATRRMTIREKQPPRRVLHVDLEPGSLLVMSYATQLHATHGIPKTPDAVGPRISLALRVKPARPAAPGGSDREP